mgnify:CR=1 FL=1
MKITAYDVATFHTEYSVWAMTEDGGAFELPPTFQKTKTGKLEAEQLIFNLTVWYGLPVDKEKIMSHFNKEILK